MDKESQHIIDRAREFRSALLGHSLSENDAREVYNECFKSLPLFSFTFFPEDFKDKFGCPPFHREIAEKLLDKSISRLAVTAPRGFSKSTLTSQSFVAHQAVYKQQRFIVLCSSTELIALDWTSKLKGNFEDNELLLRAFGHLRTRKVYDGTGTDKWTTKEFVLRHPDGFTVRFRARGAGQSIQGSNPREGRPSIFILDDIESDKNTNTPELRTANKKWLNSTVLPALTSENGRAIVIGNIIHSGGLINSLPQSSLWRCLFYQAIDSEGNSIWEEKFSLETLEEIKKDYIDREDWGSFARMWMNIPIADEERSLRVTEENYHTARWKDGQLFLNGSDSSEACNVFLGMDPGGWETSARDPSAITAIGVIPDGRTYIIETDKGHWDPDEKVDRLFAMAKRYDKPQGVGLETIRDEDLAFQIKKKMREKRYYFVLRQFGSGKGSISLKGKKADRLSSALQPMLAVNDLLLRRSDTAMCEEMYGFPRGKEDHLLDGLYMAVKISYPPSISAQPRAERKRERPREQRSWMVL